MIKKDFSRAGWLRGGYDRSEVLSFLAQVERTLKGQQSDPKKVITAEKVAEIKFSYKLGGFDEQEVDAELDRLIDVLRGLESEREREASREPSELGEEARGAARETPAAIPAPASSAPARGDAVPEAPGPENRDGSEDASSGVAHVTAPHPDDPLYAPLAHEESPSPASASSPDGEPLAVDPEYADFGTAEAVERILRSMTSSKEQ